MTATLEVMTRMRGVKTIGFVGRPSEFSDDEVRATFPPDDWRASAVIARDSGAYLIAAGQPWGKKPSGVFAFTHRLDMLLPAVLLVNGRMGDKGADVTGWIVAVPDPERAAILEALAEAAATEGTA